MICYPLLTRVLPLTTIRRERTLPVDGDVLVRMGARVDPMTVVARSEMPGRYHILNVAHAFRVSPEGAERYIQSRPGQGVKAGEVVASRRARLGFLSDVVRAPEDGMVAAVGGGRVLLESVGEQVEIRAYLPGTVSSVVPKRGVSVETIGALIQGVWGAGGESFGVLRVLAEGPDQSVPTKAIDVTSHGAVLVGGSTMDREAFQQALELQVRGIVIGSLDPSLIEMVQQMPFPTVLTEGIGQMPMAAPIFRLLSTNDGREAAISARTRARWEAMRPEVVIPLPTRSAPQPPSAGAPLEEGAQVRVTRGPLTGVVGTVRHLPPQPWAVESEAKVWGAMVAFEEVEEQFVPCFNLELLG